MNPLLLRLAALTLFAHSLHAAAPAVVWSDEFNQPVNSAPDSTKWAYDLGAGGWGNNELETYTDSRENSAIVADPAATDGKALVITAVKTTGGGYTSARLKTQGKFGARYGRIEARLKSTNGQGLWPAFWMLGDNIATVSWPACGELDVMEIIGANPNRAYGTMHGPGYSGATGLGNNYVLPGGATYDTAYHVFAIDWVPDKIVWSIDGTVYHTLTPASLPAGARWVFNDASFFLLLNLAVGGAWPGSPDGTTAFPQTYTIDYVRAYARPPAPPPVIGGFASGPRSASLSWQPALTAEGTAVAGYRIERATDSSFTQNLVTFDAGSATSFTDTTAAADTAYFYRIVSRATTGLSDPTPTLSIRTAATTTAGTALLVNIATRAYCGAGNNVAIGGFVLGGTKAKQVLVRAVGPTLTAAGLGASEVLADPVVELHHGSDLIAINDNWETNANLPEIIATASRIGATPLAATDHKSAALLLTLSPGVYSFVVNGQAGASGIVLLETYDAD